MKIEEVTKLRKQEQNYMLRTTAFNYGNLQISEDLDMQRAVIIDHLRDITKRNQKKQNLNISILIDRLIIKKSKAVKKFKGLGTTDKPYRIDCVFGKGRILNAHELFELKQYPTYIKKQFCFSNCLYCVNSLAHHGVKAKIISGIANVHSRPFLHSVIEIDNGYIVDFNYDFAMDKSLYINLFNFEILSTVSGKKLVEDDTVRRLKKKFVNAMYVNFAYDDVLSYLKNPNMQDLDVELIK